MIPRECDNDDCDYDHTGWHHVEDCEPMPPLTRERIEELRRQAEKRPNSLLASLFSNGGFA